MTACPASGPSSHKLETVENTVLYLIGHSGSGKRTIALEIGKLIPAAVVDNHYMLNPIFALLERDAEGNYPPGTWDRTREIRAAVHRTIRELSPKRKNFVFTNNLWERCAESREHFEEVLTTAETRRAFFFPVRVLVTAEELSRRVASPGRDALRKLTNVARVVAEHKNHEVYRPACDFFELDASSIAAPEAARIIVQECGKRFSKGAAR
jgi:hypothetical protein